MKQEGYKPYFSMTAVLTQWKKTDPEISFLKDAIAVCLNKTLKDLDLAWKGAFKKTKGFPRFKKKSWDKSFGFSNNIKVLDDKIILPKFSPIKFVKDCEIIGKIKNTTFSFKAGHWYVSFQTEYEQEVPVHAGGEIGIDLGIANFFAHHLFAECSHG